MSEVSSKMTQTLKRTSICQIFEEDHVHQYAEVSELGVAMFNVLLVICLNSWYLLENSSLEGTSAIVTVVENSRLFFFFSNIYHGCHSLALITIKLNNGIINKFTYIFDQSTSKFWFVYQTVLLLSGYNTGQKFY